jgi:hypothetical protein
MKIASLGKHKDAIFMTEPADKGKA